MINALGPQVIEYEDENGNNKNVAKQVLANLGLEEIKRHIICDNVFLYVKDYWANKLRLYCSVVLSENSEVLIGR